MLEPLYTSDEMKAAEAGHDVPTLMERAGRAVADEALHRFPRPGTFALYAGKGANGGDGTIDARLGTGIRGEPRAEASALIERINASGAPVLAVDIPSGVDSSTGEVAGA